MSVIVPVRNRRALLRVALDALAGQEYSDYEVIVVDDGSTDGADDAARADAAEGRRVRLVANDGTGAVTGRVTGVANSTAEVLAFTDSDCAPSPNWLKAAVAAIDSGADLVSGPTVPARALAPRERSVAAGEEGLYPTCNLVVRRRSFDDAGGFDRAAAGRLGFRHSDSARGLGFGEDTLLAWTIIRGGGQAVFEPDATVVHAVLPATWRDTISRAWLAAAFPALVKEVPELRSRFLRGGAFLGTRRIGLYLALVLALLQRPRLAALPALWWVGRCANDVARLDGSAAAKVGAVPREVAVDVVTAAALITGSVRARSLVL